MMKVFRRYRLGKQMEGLLAHSPSVEELIKFMAKAGGYSGLFCGDAPCGCGLQELAPCDSLILDECRLADVAPCDPDGCENACDSPDPAETQCFRAREASDERR